MKDGLGMTTTFEAIPGMGHSCTDAVSSAVICCRVGVVGDIQLGWCCWVVLITATVWAGSAKWPHSVAIRKVVARIELTLPRYVLRSYP